MSHIFISYSKTNYTYARRLADSLMEHGFDIWIDDRIEYGDMWWSVIVDAIRDADAFIVVMTPQAQESKWVQREIHLADEQNKPVFPLLLKGQNWPIYVTTQYVDVSSGKLPSQEFYGELSAVAPRHSGKGAMITPPQRKPTTHTRRPTRTASRLPLFVALAALAIALVIVVATLVSNGDEDDAIGDQQDTEIVPAYERLTVGASQTGCDASFDAFPFADALQSNPNVPDDVDETNDTTVNDLHIDFSCAGSDATMTISANVVENGSLGWLVAELDVFEFTATNDAMGLMGNIAAAMVAYHSAEYDLAVTWLGDDTAWEVFSAEQQAHLYFLRGNATLRLERLENAAENYASAREILGDDGDVDLRVALEINSAVLLSENGEPRAAGNALEDLANADDEAIRAAKTAPQIWIAGSMLRFGAECDDMPQQFGITLNICQAIAARFRADAISIVESAQSALSINAEDATALAYSAVGLCEPDEPSAGHIQNTDLALTRFDSALERANDPDLVNFIQGSRTSCKP